MKPSVSTEDFLKNVYLISHDDQQKVTCSFLAKCLKISNPAVTDMARKLARKGFIRYEKYKEIRLSPQGKAVAIELVRRHRLWETFLHRVLNLDLQSIHQEAERLEHQSSDELIRRISDYLGDPLFDPHGDPIPDKEGHLPEMGDVIPLSQAAKGDEGFIVRLNYNKPEQVVFFDRYHLEIGSTLKVIEKNDSNGEFEIHCGNQYFFAGKSMTKQIFITLNRHGEHFY